jgi:hypothetical protein
MTRVCLIGDSHLAALRSGWSADDFPAVRPTFFAAPAKSIGNLVVADGVLEASDDDLERHLMITSGGQTRIAGDYDHYLIHGLEFGLSLVLELCRGVPGMQNPKGWQARVTAASFTDTADAAIRNSLAIRTAAKLRQITAAPITLSPTPVSSARYSNLRRRLSENANAQAVAAVFSNACRRAVREMNGRFLPQPAETLDADGLATKPAYSREPARFLIRNPSDDAAHMNAEYGAAVLRNLPASRDEAAPEQPDSGLPA